ncbi:MAG: hypothetical protein A2Y23_15680 [Clostridiales bacterium GWB2_37_7]|nr:MAG: hypothetical protein A2Y23_15680 [Clostridiales bacterium GWB2_37_7]
MEDKIFDLLEKVYIEVQETKKDVKVINGRLDGIDGRLDGIDGRLDGIDGRLDGIDGRLDGIDGRLDGIDGKLSRLEMKVEHDISNKLDALFEFREEAMQRFDRIETKLDDLSEKVDKHDISIQVIQGGKSKKTI